MLALAQPEILIGGWGVNMEKNAVTLRW